eukprot:895483_1
MKHSSILNWLVLLIIVSNSHRLIDAELSSSSDISDSSSYECVVNADCDDGIFCNGQETCDKISGCQSGIAVDCDDKITCTDDSCNETTDTCDNIPNDMICDNGVFCDGQETCDTNSDCQLGIPIDCDDKVDCTDDSCNESTKECDNISNDINCDNGLFCDGKEICNEVSGCESGTAIECDDGIDCTVDSCNESSDTCDNIPNDMICDNGVFCDGQETCDTNGCESGTAIECDDGIDCTVDSCNESTDSYACVHTATDSLCDDNLFCTG